MNREPSGRANALSAIALVLSLVLFVLKRQWYNHKLRQKLVLRRFLESVLYVAPVSRHVAILPQIPVVTRGWVRSSTGYVR